MSSKDFVTESFVELDKGLTEAMRKKIGPSFVLSDCYKNDGGIYDDPIAWEYGYLGAYAFGEFEGNLIAASYKVDIPENVIFDESCRALLRKMFDEKYRPNEKLVSASVEGG